MATKCSVTYHNRLLSCVLASLLVAAAANASAAETTSITCGQVTALLTPCIPYGIMGGIVPPGCCSGLEQLDAAEKTAEDRRAACRCVIDGAAGIPGLNYDRVNELPGLCGTTCPYTVGPDTDCSKVN